MNKKLLAPLVATIMASSFASATEIDKESNGFFADTPISVRYNVWFQDHETTGKRYVSAQNNMIQLVGYTQDGFIPNVRLEVGKSESNLFAYTETDLSAYYTYKPTKQIDLDYGFGISNRFDARNGKADDAATLDWNATDPYVMLGASYDLQSFDGLTFFTVLEKRFNEHNTSFSGGTTTEVGARYIFVDKGDRTISAEIGYRRDIQDHKFTVTKTAEEEPTTETSDSGSTITEQENRRMLSDGFYIGVTMRF